MREAIPDPKAPLDWPHLEEHLPYLGACIREAVRLSYGVSARNPRISPDKSIRYKEWEIPAGTPVSMTIVDVHHDEENFPQSREYMPERWLGSPRTESGQSLDRYFVAFGKDARSCLGIKYVFYHSSIHSTATTNTTHSPSRSLEVFVVIQACVVTWLICCSLAHAELYLGLAALFRRFEFELFETDISDVQLAHDFFLPSPKLDSKGVRVKVRKVDW